MENFFTVAEIQPDNSFAAHPTRVQMKSLQL